MVHGHIRDGLRTATRIRRDGDCAMSADFYRRDLTYDDAPLGSKVEDWHPGETEAFMAAAIDRVRKANKMADETLRDAIAQIAYDAFGEGEDTYTKAADAILALVREKLLDPELAEDIASEMFLHGYGDELTKADTVPPIALGTVIGHLFGECHVCAEGEVRKRLAEQHAAAGGE
jgi:hypothetical protein